MRPIIGTILMLLALSAQSVAAAPVITNASELASLVNSNDGQSRNFELTGTVLTSYPHLFKSGDTTLILHGSIYQNKVKPGDAVFVKGLTQPGKVDYFYALNAKVRGKAAVPNPPCVDAAGMIASNLVYRFVTLRGRASLVFQDEIDPDYIYLALDCAGTTVFAATTTTNVPIETMPQIEGAEIEVRGALIPLNPQRNQRAYMGWLFKIWKECPIRILKPAESNPDAFPELTDSLFLSPEEVTAIGRHRISGHVLATWNESQLLMRSDDGNIHRIGMPPGQTLPKPGDRITAAGTVETDLYHLNLSHAIYRIDRTSDLPVETPRKRTLPDVILSNERGEQMIKPAYGGSALCIRGIVRQTAQTGSDGPLRRFELDCGKHIVPVVIGDSAEQIAIPVAGSKVDVSGCCVMDVDNWLPTEPFPRIRGIFVVTRTADDIRILSNPPWWTPGRFAVALSSVLVLLIGILVWNQTLRRLVEKRSRELADEQVAHAKSEFRTLERTNLAIELHDTLSQDLAAVACQIAAATSQFHANSSEALKNLATSETMLLSCRTELKRCLWDLRNDTLEDADLTHAIRRTLESLVHGVNLTVRFNVPRDCLTDTSAHALLCIVRELVSNAIVHGKATSVKIAGSLEGGRILFSVIDDGRGFDPLSRPGPDTGHFGLAGIEARIKRLHGKLTMRSAPGKGTRAAVMLSIAEPEDQ